MLSENLVNNLLEFRRLRDWEQFHSPRNIASAISIEASELLEHFVWALDPQIPAIVDEQRSSIEEEMADLAILMTYLAHDLAIDLEAAVKAKVAANEKKYPVEKAKGTNKKYTAL